MIFNSFTVQKYKGYYRVGKKVVMKVGDKKFYGKVIAIAPLIAPNKFEIVVVEVSS